MPDSTHTSASRPRKRLERLLVGLAIFVAGAAAGTFLVTRFVAPVPFNTAEGRVFQAQYGPSQNSEFGEEWLIRDFFKGKRDGVFLDVGASHYRIGSNTYYLETEWGWSGLAIDPLVQFEADYLKYRPRTRFRPFFISDTSDEKASIYVLESNTRVTSSDKSFTDRFGSNASEVTAPTITLDKLLEAERITAIDFMSMDIELAEPKALAGFDIERFRPALVCIEAHPEVRQQILDYFARHHYVAVGKYLRADQQNLYFTPLTTD